MREHCNPIIGLDTEDAGIDTGSPVFLEFPIPFYPSPCELPQGAARLLAVVQVRDLSDRVLRARYGKQDGFLSYPVGLICKPVCQRGVGL